LIAPDVYEYIKFYYFIVYYYFASLRF